MKRDELREKLIALIEGHTGSLLDMPYHSITTSSLVKIAVAIDSKRGTPLHLTYLNSDIED